ncbi:TonB-dependent receptor [Sphingomonas oligophenolica]|uniref:TonB-dependent receptor n=1 Tax=Sphingomonas oligophenolica TaxID=301154 RepID=A0ABU9Y179_9SPHN
MRTIGFPVLLASSLCIVAVAAPVHAQDRSFNIAAGSLKSALDMFSRQSGLPIIYKTDQIRGIRSEGFRGTASAQAALGAILDKSGFVAWRDRSGAIAIVRAASASSLSDGAVVAPAENALASADPVAGPSGASDPVAVPGDIIVTANKSRQRLIDVPASITAETGAQLRRRGATQLEDIVANTPGLINPGAGGGNNTNLTIRGVTTDTSLNLKQPTVAVLFDDIPVDPATAGLTTTNLRIVDIERVEVLRGPQGTLFGSGSLSGAVRYITNKPDMTKFSGSVEGTVASTKDGAGSQWGDAVVNVPLVSDRVAIRAVGYGFNEGGWVDNIRTGQRDANRNKTYGGRIALAAKPTEEFSISLTGAYQNSRDYALGDSLYAQPAGIDGQVTTERASNSNTAKSTLANLGLRYDFGAVSLFSSSTYIRRTVDSIDDGGFYTDAVAAIFGLPIVDHVTPARTFNAANIYTQELRLSSKGGGPLRWTVGGFYLRANTGGGQTISAPGLVPFLGTDNLTNLRSTGRQQEIAGFGEVTYTIAHRLDLTAGLRVSSTKLDITSVSNGILLTGGPTFLTLQIPQRQTSYDPRFAVMYHPTSHVSLYAQASRGYRIGGANLTAGLGGPGIPTSYGSDSLWNYEAGIKASLLGGRLQLNGAGYYIDWKNLQVSLLSNNINYTGNAGSARIYGMELEVAAKPLSWLDVGGSMALSNAALTEDAPTLVRTTGLIGAKDGDRLPASPRTQGAAYAQLNFSRKGDAAYVRASGQYIGPSYTDFASQGIRFGDYATLDLRAGIIHKNVEISIFGRNLLDSDGARSAAPTFMVGPVLALPQVAYRIRPRTIGITGRVGF